MCDSSSRGVNSLLAQLFDIPDDDDTTTPVTADQLAFFTQAPMNFDNRPPVTPSLNSSPSSLDCLTSVSCNPIFNSFSYTPNTFDHALSSLTTTTTATTNHSPLPISFSSTCSLDPTDSISNFSTTVTGKQKDLSIEKPPLECNIRNDSDDEQNNVHLSSQSNKRRVLVDEERRRRNTEASARFRQRKKAKEQALEKTAAELCTRLDQMQRRIKELETENAWLRGILIDRDGIDVATKISRFVALAASTKTDRSPNFDLSLPPSHINFSIPSLTTILNNHMNSTNL